MRSAVRASDSRGARLGGVPIAGSDPMVASLELRPSWRTNVGHVGLQNLVEIGYRISPVSQLSLLQEFDVNLQQNSGRRPSASGLVLHNAYLKARLDRLWTNGDSTLSLSIDPIFYLPTDKDLRQAGLVTGIRNDVRLSKKLSDRFILSFTETPIFFIYSQVGTNVTGDFRANPFFENRVALSSDVYLTQDLIFSTSLILAATRYAYYKPDTLYSDRWDYKLRFYPEISYIVGSHTALGLAFNTESLIATDFTGLNIANGFEKGTLQFVLQAWL